MFIELIDLLRCTRPHEDCWLVATFYEMRERTVVEGLLSCPVCGARYPVAKGVVHFDVSPGTPLQPAAAGPELNDDGVRVAAYLNLIEPGIVVLGGAWASATQLIVQLGSTVIALNSAEDAGGRATSRVRSDGIVPLARECVDGIALDISTMDGVQSAAHALKTGSRMVAPVAAPVPEGFVELARDEGYWVAVRQGGGASAPVQIARR